MRRRAGCLLLLFAVGISACGRPDAVQSPPDEPTAATAAPLAVSPVAAESAYPPVMDSAYPPLAADNAYPAVDEAATTVDEWSLRAHPTAMPIVKLTPVARGPLLREVLPPVPQGTPATTHLISSELILSPGKSFGERNIFWEIDLRDLQRTQLAEVSTMSWSELRGAIAPDGSHIAYIDTPFESTILRVMRPDGSADREIAQGVGTTSPSAASALLGRPPAPSWCMWRGVPPHAPLMTASGSTMWQVRACAR